eukprot:9476478-Pyramimonas_sp.AAC.1
MRHHDRKCDCMQRSWVKPEAQPFPSPLALGPLGRPLAGGPEAISRGCGMAHAAVGPWIGPGIDALYAERAVWTIGDVLEVELWHE